MQRILHLLTSLALGLGTIVACAGQEDPTVQPPVPNVPAGPALPIPGGPAPFAVGQLPGGQLPIPRKAVAPGLDPVLELVEFRDLSLTDAMRILSAQSGLKIVPSAEAAKTKVSLYLTDVQASVAVSAVAQANGLIVRQEPNGIYRIFSPKENLRDLTAFRDEQTQVFTLLYPNALNVAKAIADLYADRVQLSYGLEDSRNFQDLQERFDRFDLLNSRQFGLGFGGGGGGGGFGGGSGGGLGGGGGFGGGGGNSFGGSAGSTGRGGSGSFGSFGTSGLGSRISDNVRQQRDFQNILPDVKAIDRYRGALTPDEQQAIDDIVAGKEGADRSVLLDILRRRPATIYVTAIRSNNQLIVRTSDSNAMAQITDLVCKLDVPTPVVLLEVKVLTINLQDDFRSAFDFQFTDGHFLSGGFTPGIADPNSPFATGNILPPGADVIPPPARRQVAINPGAIGNAPPPNFLFQMVSSNFRARLQLLETKGRVTEVASPLIMTANNEVSQIFIGNQVPITVGFTPGTSNIVAAGAQTVTTSTPITTLQQIGTTLLITPNINADRTVTLRILEQRSSLNGTSNIPVPNSNGGVTEVPVDIVAQQTLTGTVVAKDGLTLAMGGLIEEHLEDQRQEVPVLGHIPYLGVLFRTQFTQRMRTETVILIRPFVMTTSVEGAQISKCLTESLSIHPLVQDNLPPTMNSFTPAEPLRANPPVTPLQTIFQVHTVRPKDF